AARPPFRAVVRALPDERVVEDDCIADAEHRGPRGEPSDSLAHDGRERSFQDTACIGQLEPAHALGLPREEALEQLETPGQIAVEIGELGVAEAIQLTLRARLEADRAARAVQGQGRADEALADAGNDRDGE